MEIYKILADEKPAVCLLCPLASSKIRIDLQCGKLVTRDIGEGWECTSLVPDDRCKFEVVD